MQNPVNNYVTLNQGVQGSNPWSRITCINNFTYTKVKELLTKHRSSLGVFLMLSKGKNMKEKAPDAGADSLSKYGFATLII